MQRFCLLILLLLFSLKTVPAQTGKITIPESYDGIRFTAFADSLLKNHRLKIFYKQEWVSGIRIVVKDGNNKLEEVFERTFHKRPVFYVIDKAGNVVLSKSAAIQEDLPLSYFEPEKDSFYTSLESGMFEDDDPEVPTEAEGSHINVDIGNPADPAKSGQVVVSGIITEKGSGEPVIGATIYSNENMEGTVSNVSGQYFLKLPGGSHTLTVRCIGKKEVEIDADLYSDGILNVVMEDKVTELKAVVITSQKYHNIESTSMGLNRIDTRMLSSIPVIGEADVMKVSMLLPGVQSVGEGTTGFNVRGGNTDQNLILLDKAPVFNPSHLMGFFSAFNSDIIRDFELHKSVIPAKMGGRLSSVMDLNVKNGNKKKFSGNGGISPLTGRLMLEGPLIKDKMSFLVSGRSTYSNWILKRINNESISKSRAGFYDVNAKIDYDINTANSVNLSAYNSSDVFVKNDGDTTFAYSNSTLNLGWKHKFNPRYLLTTNLIYSNYNNSIEDVSDESQAYKVSYNIDYYEWRSDFIYFLNNDHTVNYGVSSIYYDLLPGKNMPAGAESLLVPDELDKEHALETALYLSDEFRVNEKLQINAGLRYSLYTFTGPATVYEYTEGLPIDLSTLRDTLQYSSFEAIKNYHGPEPRISLRYMLNRDLSVKAGYSRMRQYIHIMSNTFSVSPTDTWKLSDNNLRPQVADQLSLGLYRNFRGGMIETSAEVYYKKIRGLKDYKVAATLLMNEHVETEIIDVEGKAYGAEFLIKKPAGKFNGWISYTYSRILQRSDGEYLEEQINNNNWFPAVYDKPHSLSLVANYRFSRRVSVTTDVVYSTGRPITYPVARYRFRNGTYLHYSNRNQFRIDDYFRWDISVNLDQNLRTDQIAHSYWSLSVYNLTGRDNIYSVYFISQGRDTQGYKMSIFAEPVVSLSFNFRF